MKNLKVNKMLDDQLSMKLAKQRLTSLIIIEHIEFDSKYLYQQNRADEIKKLKEGKRNVRIMFNKL